MHFLKAKIDQKLRFRVSKIAKMANFALLESSKLISRKISVIQNSWNFHTVNSLKSKLKYEPMYKTLLLEQLLTGSTQHDLLHFWYRTNNNNMSSCLMRLSRCVQSKNLKQFVIILKQNEIKLGVFYSNRCWDNFEGLWQILEPPNWSGTKNKELLNWILSII